MKKESNKNNIKWSTVLHVVMFVKQNDLSFLIILPDKIIFIKKMFNLCNGLSIA